jgi:hypothetical protein
MTLDQGEIAKGVIEGLLKSFGNGIKKPFKILRKKPSMVFVENKDRCLWTTAKTHDGKQAIQIMTSSYATNISDKPIKLLGARLLKPKVGKKFCREILFMVNRKNNSVQGGLDMPIAPGQTETVEATFFLNHPKKIEKKSLAVRLAIKDQYGKEHKTPKITLNHPI